MRRFRLVAASAALLTLMAAVTPAAAKKPLPAQCPDGRFLVQGTPLIAGVGTPTIEAVTFGPSVAISTGCTAMPAKVTRTRKGTVVKVAWPSCTGLPAKAKLSATILAPDCDTMKGALTAPKTKPKKHPLTALRSRCGDGVVDADGGEQCDGAGTCAVASDPCSDQCQCSSGSTTTSTTIVAGTTSTTSTSSTIQIPSTTVTTITVTTTITQPTVSTTIVTTTTIRPTTTSSTIANAPPAVVELNEVEPALTGNHDLIELHVLSGGTCKGITIEQAGAGNPILLATLPDAVVATDDLIVVHLNPLGGPGNPPPPGETSSKTEFPALTYLSNYDGAWDFLGSPSAIAFGTRVVQVRSAGGELIDALPATKQPYNDQDTFLASLQAIQAAGLWFPADCGGSACTNVSTPAAKDIIVNWNDVGPLPTDPSAARRAGAHTHQASDWATGPSSMGAPNP